MDFVDDNVQKQAEQVWTFLMHFSKQVSFLFKVLAYKMQQDILFPAKDMVACCTRPGRICPIDAELAGTIFGQNTLFVKKYFF